MKKLLATLLASAMALTTVAGLVACGGGDTDDPNTLIVWAPENSLGDYDDGTGYKGMIAGWKEANPDYAHFDVKFVAKGEGEANSGVGNNPKAAAEVFFFASDHYRDLVHNKGLQPLTDEYVEEVKARDDQSTYEFVTDKEDKMWAFPTTNDNGYFLWYNDQMVTAEQAKNLDTLISAAKAKNAHIHYEYGTAWYAGSFIMGMGIDMNYDQDDNYVCPINTAAAQAGATAMFNYANSADNKGTISEKGTTTKSNVMVSMSNFKAGFADNTCAAAISYTSAITDIENAYRAAYTNKATGLVDEEKVKTAMSHIQATVLPKFKATLNGETKDYHMGTFYGGKYCGVNRSKSAEKIKASLSLANWFTSYEGQVVRFEADGSGPSNKDAAKLKAVQDSKGLKAYQAQLALGEEYNCIMGKQKGAYWDNISTFATGVFEQKKSAKDKVDYTTEEGVLKQLKNIADKIDE